MKSIKCFAREKIDLRFLQEASFELFARFV